MITGEEIKTSVLKNNITWIPHHDCALCGQFVGYSVDHENLYFESSCGCSYSPPQPRPWSDAAEWVNMQSKDEHKIKIMEKFGINTKKGESL